MLKILERWHYPCSSFKVLDLRKRTVFVEIFGIIWFTEDVKYDHMKQFINRNWLLLRVFRMILTLGIDKLPYFNLFTLNVLIGVT